MNKNKLLKRKEKAITDLELYEACSEIFHLLRDNRITSISLKNLSVDRRKISQRLTYTTADEGEWHAWATIARQPIDGTIIKPFGLQTGTAKDFVKAYRDEYRELLREEVYQRNGKIVEIPDQPKTR